MSDEANLTVLKTDQTDAEFATEIRNRARPHLEELVKLADECRRRKTILSWSIGLDAFGLGQINEIAITKKL